MAFGVKWTSGPLVTKSNTCGSCGRPFACEISFAGCWCSKVTLTDRTRQQLREKYIGCLCPACLEAFALEGHG